MITFYSAAGGASGAGIAKAYNISGNSGDKYYIPFRDTPNSNCIPSQVTYGSTNSLLSSQGYVTFIPASLTVSGAPVDIRYIGDGQGKVTCDSPFGIIPPGNYNNISGLIDTTDYSWVRTYGVYVGGAIITIQ
jgi:hypothetical protein